MAGKDRPELHRVANAALVAAFAAAGSMVAVALALLAAQPGSIGAIVKVIIVGFVVGVPLASLHAFGLGLPFYLLLRGRWALTAHRAVLGGFGVAAAPWLLLALGTGIEASAVAGALGAAGLTGAVGGFVFWAMLRE